MKKLLLYLLATAAMLPLGAQKIDYEKVYSDVAQVLKEDAKYAALTSKIDALYDGLKNLGYKYAENIPGLKETLDQYYELETIRRDNPERFRNSKSAHELPRLQQAMLRELRKFADYAKLEQEWHTLRNERSLRGQVIRITSPDPRVATYNKYSPQINLEKFDKRFASGAPQADITGSDIFRAAMYEAQLEAPRQQELDRYKALLISRAEMISIEEPEIRRASDRLWGLAHRKILYQSLLEQDNFDAYHRYALASINQNPAESAAAGKALGKIHLSDPGFVMLSQEFNQAMAKFKDLQARFLESDAPEAVEYRKFLESVNAKDASAE